MGVWPIMWCPYCIFLNLWTTRHLLKYVTQNNHKAATQTLERQHCANLIYHWHCVIRNTEQAQGQLAAMLLVVPELSVCQWWGANALPGNNMAPWGNAKWMYGNNCQNVRVKERKRESWRLVRRGDDWESETKERRGWSAVTRGVSEVFCLCTGIQTVILTYWLCPELWPVCEFVSRNSVRRCNTRRHPTLKCGGVWVYSMWSLLCILAW